MGDSKNENEAAKYVLQYTYCRCIYPVSIITHATNERSVVDVWEKNKRIDTYPHMRWPVFESVPTSSCPARTQMPHFQNLACWVRKSSLILTKSAEGPFENTY